MTIKDLNIKTGRITNSGLIRYASEGYIPIFICRFMNPMVKMYEGTELHMIDPSPSSELLFKSKSGKIEFDEYKIEYLKEMENKGFSVKEFLDKILNLIINNQVNAKGVVLLCYCKDRSVCHRSILADMINESNLVTNKVVELYV